MALFLPTGGPDPLPLPPLPGFGWITGIINIIGSVLGIAFGGGSTAQLEQQITQLRDEATQAIHHVAGLAIDIARGLGALLTWLHDLWTGLLKTILNLLKVFRALLKWLFTEALPALLKALRNLRQLLNDIYRRYIRPALNYLQLVRRYLAILRILHVPFAQKLDQIIVKLEGRIVGPFLYVLRTLNGIGSWVNVILTAGGVLQRPVFVNTVYAYQRDWINLWWAGQSSAGGPGVPPSPGTALQPRTPAQINADFSEFVTAGAGPIADIGARSMVTFQSVLSGGPAIPGAFNPS